MKFSLFRFTAMLVCLILLALAATSTLITVALGQDAAVPVTLSWTNPTTRVDGSALDPELILETRIWCDTEGWPPTRFVPPSATSVVIEFAPGVHSCYLKTALTETDADGKKLVSDASTALEFTVEAPRAADPAKPEAPREVKATQVIQE